MLDDWTELLESGSKIDVIHTDLEKAFDKVPYCRLISKLHSYHLNKKIILWSESFLIDRKQRVKIDEVMSQWSDVLSGIPQGSIHGIYLYADNARLCNHIKSRVDAEILVKKW